MRTSQKLWYCAITAHASPVALLTLCPWWQWAMGRPGFKHMPWAPVLVAGLAALAVAPRRELGCTCGSCWVCGARAGSFKPRHTWLIFPAFATCNVFAIMMVTQLNRRTTVSKWLCGAAPTAVHRQLDNEQNQEEARYINPKQMRAARHTYRELSCQAWTAHFLLVCMFSQTKVPEKQGAAYGQAPSLAAQQSVYATYTMRHVSFFLPAIPLLHTSMHA